MSIQKLYDYLFRTLANIPKDTPAEFVADKKSAKTSEIEEFFSSVKKDKEFKIFLKNIEHHALYEALYKIPLKPSKKNNHYFISDEEIIEAFKRQESAHHLFDNQSENSTLHKKYIEFYKMAQIINHLYESNADEDDEDEDEEQSEDENNQKSEINGYKLLVLFGDEDLPQNYFKSLDSYLKMNNFLQANNPIHDAIVNNLPKCKSGETINLPAWREFINQYGPKGARLFARAAVIEKALGRPPKDLSDAIETLTKVSYPRRAENPELAAIAAQYYIDNETFEKCLAIKRKKSDRLPNEMINGSTVNQPGYYLVKLPIDDPRAYFLGEITNCCQSVGNEGEVCVRDGLTLENNGFYVLLKKTNNKNTPPMVDNKIDYSAYKIVGQSYAWKSKKGNLVFDSWENVAKSAYDGVTVSMLREFAKQVCDKNPDILQVVIGQGGKTPDVWSQADKNASEKMLEGKNYGDAANQTIIYYNEKYLKQLRDFFIVELKIQKDKVENVINRESFTNYKQVDEIISTFRDPFFQQTNNLKSFFDHLEKSGDLELQPYLWKGLYILKKEKILAEKTVKKLYESSNSSRDYRHRFYKGVKNNAVKIANYFAALNKIGFLNDKSMQLIVSHTTHGEAICEVYILLGEKFFTDKIYDILNNNAQFAGNIAECLDFLISYKMLTVDNINLLLQPQHDGRISREHVKRQSDFLFKFKKYNILNEETIQIILNCRLSLAEAIIILHNANILTEENKALIYSSTAAKELADTFIKLQRYPDLNTQPIKTALASNSYFSSKVMDGLLILSKANILSDKNIFFLAALQHDPFSSQKCIFTSVSHLLVSLDNKKILNDSNREFIANYAKKGVLIDLLLFIAKRNIFTETNFDLLKSAVNAINNTVDLNTTSAPIERLLNDITRLNYTCKLPEIALEDYLKEKLNEYDVRNQAAPQP